MTTTAPAPAVLTATTDRPLSRPVSEVSDVTGLIGALTLCAVLALARIYALPLVAAVALCLGAPAFVMVLSAVLIEKAHLRDTTELDFSLRRPWPEVAEITRTKVAGLGATFFLVALAYFAIRTYRDPGYGAYFISVEFLVPAIWLMSPLYIAFTTRHMRAPRDGLWHFGKLISLDWRAVDFAQVKHHLLGWTIKAFFLAFMATILPGAVARMLGADLDAAFTQPVTAIKFLVQSAFLLDICIGTIGYIMTFRVFDSHIRSANPYLAGWLAALACYPPFALMGAGGPLDYRSGTQEWSVWLQAHPALLTAWGAVIVLLAMVYAWATVVFGLRFSNLTHRGIITAGPYRFLRHPAYVSKNLMWWMMHVPFLATAGAGEAVRNCMLLLAVNAIYFARARTEERHLMADPAYQAYSAWVTRHGIWARLVNACDRVRGRKHPGQ